MNNSLSTYNGNGASTFGVSSIDDANVETIAQGWIFAAVNGPQQTYSLTQLTTTATSDNQSFVYPGPPGVTLSPRLSPLDSRCSAQGSLQ